MFKLSFFFFLNESQGTTLQVKYISFLSLKCLNIKESWKQVGGVYQQNLLLQGIPINLEPTVISVVIFSVRCTEMWL